MATFFWQVAAAVLPLAPGAEVDFPDFTGAFYALLRKFQRILAPLWSPRCSVVEKRMG